MDQSFAVGPAGACAALRMRPVREDDIPFIDALIARLFPTVAQGSYTMDEVVSGTRRVLRAAIAEAAEDALFEIAEDEQGERHGFIYAITVRSFFTDEPYAHISEIVAARDRTGAGRLMMERAAAWSRARGYRRISLNVMHSNADARAFYAKLGYRPEVERLWKGI